MESTIFFISKRNMKYGNAVLLTVAPTKCSPFYYNFDEKERLASAQFFFVVPARYTSVTRKISQVKISNFYSMSAPYPITKNTVFSVLCCLFSVQCEVFFPR